MFYITQSNDINQLFEFLLSDYQQKNEQIFEPFIVIVPSKVMGDWLKKQVADKAGISTLVTTEFWGRYQWTLMQSVLKQYAKLSPTPILRVPEVAVLSQSVMQWRLFGYFVAQKHAIIKDTSHPLHAIVVSLLTDKEKSAENPDLSPILQTPLLQIPSDSEMAASQFDNPFVQVHHSNQQKTDEQRLWQLADDMARMLGRYMTYRPDWLVTWGVGQALPIAEMVAEKDRFFSQLNHTSDEQYTPDWLIEQLVEVEIAQRYLWQQLFHDTYAYRQAIESQFWQALQHQDESIAQVCRAVLPERIILFTLQQLPPSELKMMKQLSTFTVIKLLHYNPSQMFWADIVDKNWLLTQRFIHPDSVYYKDYGHTLLSRFGKQSREVFAMLAYFAGNDDQTLWQDAFVPLRGANTLLSQLQQDILMLQEQRTGKQMQDILDSLTQRIYQPTRIWQYQDLDNSLSIHACHSPLRQLEVVRSMIVGWLNYVDKPSHMPQAGAQIDFLNHAHGNSLRLDARRSLSDILILLPDIEAQQNLIESVFPKGVGTDGYDLPAKVTGVVSKDINQLWTAMVGYFDLLNQAGARFDKATVFDWLLLPPLYESFGLSLEEMTRGCELLEMAGFIRGFDELHLAASLHAYDDDYRFSFAYALERLVAGVLMPQALSTEFGHYINRHGEQEQVLPLANVQLADVPIVAVLTDIYQTLDRYRHSGEQLMTAEAWLAQIEAFIHEKFAIFEQTNALNAIWAAQNAFKQNIIANQRYEHFSLNTPDNTWAKTQAHTSTPENLPLKLGFILSSMANELASQQVSAEPAGVITFGRIGAVRNLPYKLVIMLNLNLADFPKRDTTNRYDLMQAGRARQGDRFKEDDEMGAFLDAILSAKEACWLFYNGASVNDSNEHLPASPVQELIGFLTDEVQWKTAQHQSDQQNTNPQNATDTLPNGLNSALIQQWLITRHPAVPFADTYFYQEKETETTENPAIEQDTKKATKKETKQQRANKTKQVQTKPAKAIGNDVPAENLPVIDNTDTGFQNKMPNFEQSAKQIAAQIRYIKNQQKILYPPAKVWHSVFEQLHQQQFSPPKAAQKSRIAIWQKSQLTTWLAQWQRDKNFVNGSGLTPNSEMASEHVALDFIIKGMQKPAQHFINTHQIRLAQAVEIEANNEPLELDSLANYQINAYLIAQLKAKSLEKTANLDTSQLPSVLPNTPQQTLQKLDLLPFSNELPAGVSRHLILQAQQKKLEQACASLLQKIQHSEVIPPSALERLTRAMTQNSDEHTGKKKKASACIAELLTPCHEQRISVVICQLAETQPPILQHMIVTANLPLYEQAQTSTDQVAINPNFWVQYLPTNGKEKYQLQFWLYHLCWQVLRRTSAEQVQAQDGFSLWQYGTATTLFLPPIAHEQAYAYLQDWLMAWQFFGQQLMLLPPSVTLKFLSEQQKRQAEGKFDNDTIPKIIADAGWKKDSHANFISEDNPDHASWQFLLAGQNAERAIIPSLQTVGAWLYQPILDNLKIA